MTTNQRKTPGYNAWVKKVLKHCDPVCIRCGYPVDMTLPPSDPQGPTADHEPPLIETGEATPSLDGAGIAHNHCNKSHGGRLGSKRQQDARPPITRKKTNDPAKRTNTATHPVFKRPTMPPPAPTC